MVSNRWLASLGILVLFGTTAWGQSNTAVSQPKAESAAAMTSNDSPGHVYSSSKAQPDSVSTIALADFDLLPRTGAMAAAPAVIATPVRPVKKTESDDKNYARNKKIWFSLAAMEHSAAGFDAWSTRQAVNRGGQELNPFMAPFANSAAMYPAAQVVPFGVDYLAHRMMRSNNHVVRKLWWLPQTATTVASLAAGIHNMGVN